MALFAALALFVLVFHLVAFVEAMRNRGSREQTTPAAPACSGEKEKTRQTVVFITALFVLVFHLVAFVEATRNRGSREQAAPAPASCDREKKEPLQAMVFSALFVLVSYFVFARPTAGCERGDHATTAASARRCEKKRSQMTLLAFVLVAHVFVVQLGIVVKVSRHRESAKSPTLTASPSQHKSGQPFARVAAFFVNGILLCHGRYPFCRIIERRHAARRW